MLFALADHNFKAVIEEGLLRRGVQFDVVHLRDVGLQEATDPDVLAWAAADGRILLTHDRKTMLPAAFERVADGLAMPGVVFVPWLLDLGTAIEHLEVLLGCEPAEYFANQVVMVPLR